MADLFISYSHEDVVRIQPLVAALEAEGWSVFWDRHIPAGQTWRSYIGNAIDTSQCVIVAWSEHSVNSKWVTEEADVGQKRNALVPIFLDEVKIPIGFRSIQAADLTQWQPDRPSPEFEALVNDIHRLLEPPKSSTKPSSPRAVPRPASRSYQRPFSASKVLKQGIWRYVGILVVGLALFWAYRTYLAEAQEPELSGLVFATEVEANGLAVDPGTSFPQDIKSLYAVFRGDMAPPGMAVNVIDPLEGKYYSNLEVIDSTNISALGWRWYHKSERVNYYNTPVKTDHNYWLAYSDYSEGGIFSNNFEPGTYTIVILLDGNPAMSADLVITPLTEQ